jgi:hypothetical protein
MAAGDFSASQLLQIRLKMEQMWADSRLAKDKKANAQAAIAVKENSTARFSQLENKDKDNKVKVTFVNPCAVVDQACTSDCEIAATELETGGKEYELDLCREAEFSVDAETLRTNDYNIEQVAAEGLAAAVKVLDEWWSGQIMVKLKAFAGINVSPEPYTWAAGTTTVPAAQYNVNLVKELVLDAMMNKLSNPYYIDNGSLWGAWWDAQMQAKNLDGAGDAAKISQLKMYFDMYSFAKAGITEDTFAVDASAVAFHTKTRHSDTPEYIGGKINQTRYTIKSGVIPGVKYDAFYQISCATVAGIERIYHTWKLKTRGGIFLNPEGCTVTVNSVNYNPTGVLSYTKGA